MTTFVLGAVQSDFARNLARDGRELVDLVGELVDRVLADAELEVSDVQTVHVGNAFGELFVGQGQLGAMPATARPALWGVPAVRHEAACASGSIAILAAMAELEAGFHDVALVLGAEQERNVDGERAARFMGAAAWAGHEGQEARYLWPAMFAQLGDVYAERHGLDHRHLTEIARTNFANARANPDAQTRAWTIGDESFAADDRTNPIVEGRLRRADCAQVTDGGATLVLASSRFAAAWAQQRGRSLDRTAKILGWGLRTVGLPLAAKLARAPGDGLLFPHVADAFAQACARAGVSRDQLHGAEVHDCFTTTEYMIIDHLGLAPPGQPWRAIEDGTIARGGRFPINPSGGLIGGGHPVGATGVRMAADAARQVTGRAGGTQVDGAKRFATLNIGGSATTVASLVIGV